MNKQAHSLDEDEASRGDNHNLEAPSHNDWIQRRPTIFENLGKATVRPKPSRVR